MKELRPGGTRLRLHGDKDKAQGLRVFAMRKLQGFLATCNEDQEVCGPWKVEFSDGSWVKLSQLYDQPVIDIYVPELKHIVLRKDLEEGKERIEEKKEKLKIETKIVGIVPGFCLSKPETSGVPQDIPMVHVCEFGGWDSQGNFRRKDKFETPNYREERIDLEDPPLIQGLIKESLDTRIEGLRVISEDNYENVNYTWGILEGSEFTDDQHLVPGPLSLDDNPNWDFMTQEPLYTSGGIGVATKCPSAGNIWEQFGYYWPAPPWFVHRYTWDNGECFEYVDPVNSNCCKNGRYRNWFDNRARCTKYRLFFHGVIMERVQWWHSPDASIIMGICFNDPTCLEDQYTIVFEHKNPEYGGTQKREYSSGHSDRHDITIYSKYGNIHLDVPVERHQFNHRIGFWVMNPHPEPCPSFEDSEITYREWGSIYRVWGSCDGGILPDNKAYFTLYNEIEVDQTAISEGKANEHKTMGYLSSAPDPIKHWHTQYHGDWYDCGTIDPVGGTTVRPPSNVVLKLHININGEDQVIDEHIGPHNPYGHWSLGTHWQFQVLHTNVFQDKTGAVQENEDNEREHIYMYSYCLARMEVVSSWPTVHERHIEYIRYGYFYKGKHYQSKKFESAGYYDDDGNELPYHDVFDSVKNHGFYANGNCAAFYRERKIGTEDEFETGETIFR